jgi:hypothetical protein
LLSNLLLVGYWPPGVADGRREVESATARGALDL